MEISRQLAFLGAFLGGFAATFLATLLVVDSSRRVADWVIGSAAAAACSFVVAVIASVTLTVVLHPEAPANVSASASIGAARVIATLGFGVGIYALLASVGLSGWIRSRRTGLGTSAAAAVGLVLASWGLAGFR
jgi:hypothetical protein